MENKFKRVNIIFLIAILIILLLNIVFYIVSKYSNAKIGVLSNSANDDRISIIIDPGHGGLDTGAPNKYGEDESYINLKICKYLFSMLNSSGFDVIMTRYNDDGLYDQGIKSTIREKKNEDLHNRIELINSSNADIVVSVHLNSFTQKKYYGAQTFYKVNDEKSKLAAQVLQKKMKSILDKDNKRVPQVKKDVKIIDKSEKTIVLVECGFLSNEAESTLLCTKDYQEKVAWAIYSGILEYFSQSE